MSNSVLYYHCCSLLSNALRCPVCRCKHGRQPEPADVCFLTEQDKLWSALLEDILRQHSIPAITKSNIGVGMAMKAGSMFERIKFYVPYSYMAQAKDIVDALFAEISNDEIKFADTPYIENDCTDELHMQKFSNVDAVL